jgi:hypothetical protein
MNTPRILAGLCALAAGGILAGCTAAESATPLVRPAAQQPVAEQVTTQSPLTTTPPGPPTPCSITDGACADLSGHKAWLLKDGKIAFGPVPIMPGSGQGTGYGPNDTATPVGTFTVTKKSKHYWSRQFDQPMPNSVFFYPGIAFHAGSLTEPSHGCVHLSDADSQRFFDDLRIGDAVQIVP